MPDTKIANHHYPIETKEQCRNLYVSGKMQPAELSEHLNVPVSTVYNWISRNDWADAREKATSALMRNSDHEIKSIIASTRVNTMKRQLSTFSAVERAIIRILCETDAQNAIKIDENGDFVVRSDLQPRDIKALASAAKDCASVTSSLLGLSNNSASAANSSKSNTINFNISPKQEVPFIDVTPDRSIPPPTPSISIYDAEDNA